MAIKAIPKAKVAILYTIDLSEKSKFVLTRIDFLRPHELAKSSELLRWSQSTLR